MISWIVLGRNVVPLVWLCRLSDTLYSVVHIHVETLGFVVYGPKDDLTVVVELHSVRFEVELRWSLASSDEVCWIQFSATPPPIFGFSGLLYVADSCSNERFESIALLLNQ